MTLMVVSSLARLLLFLWNSEMAAAIPAPDLIMGFVVGLRFDLIINSAVILPLFLGLLLPNGLARRYLWIGWLMVMSALTVLAALVEPFFYAEFHSRLNSIAIQYLNEDPATVVSMIINGTPFFSLLLVWACILGVLLKFYLWLDKSFREPNITTGIKSWLSRIPVLLFTLLLLVIGLRRGTFRSAAPPALR